MKLVIRTVLFHFLSIFSFAIIYLNMQDDFSKDKEKKHQFVDYLLLSTTIQAGVGMTDIYPLSFHAKVLVMIQQLMMICTHVLTLYIFNL
jgi:hypothetical protein